MHIPGLSMSGKAGNSADLLNFAVRSVDMQQFA
jgi:hypothetical protein